MDVVYSIAYTSFLIPLATLGASFFIKNVSQPIRLIRYLVSVGFLVDCVCLILGRKGFNTYPIGNLFLLFQTIITLLIYRDVLKNKKLIDIVGIFYIIMFVFDYFFIHGPEVLNSYSHSLSSVIFIFLSLFYFRDLLIELPVEFVYHMPMVWINLAILVYYSGNLFLFSLNNFFSNGSEGNQRIVWALHNLLNIAKNILLIISIWQSPRKTS